MTVDHPLSMLDPAEIEVARAVLIAAGVLSEGAAIAHIVLQEPEKSVLAEWSAGDPVDRRVRVLVVPGPELMMVECVVSIADQVMVDRTVIDGMRPALLMGESFGAIVACTEHPEYLAALARRGIHDVADVQIDPWPAGSFGYAAEEGRRIARCISFLRDHGDNGYARPIEGLLVHVDLGRGEVIEVIDHGIVPVPTEHGRYGIDDCQPARDDLQPIEITQSEGVSFTLNGNHLRWQGWDVRLTFDPYEGLVLHQLGITLAGAERRSVAHRLSMSEMVVPYGDPGEVQGWKNAFDGGEWGLGRMTQSLELGCDCLGDITYLDAVMANEQGEPWVVPNAICLHEEDTGIGWKHVDLWSGTAEVRRGRRMVISHIATVGNYEYAFYWSLHLDGNVQLEVKLTGILSSQAAPAGAETPHAVRVAPGVVAPVHQHLFCVRLDLDVDGVDNIVEELDIEVLPPGEANPWANAFVQRRRVLASESEAQRETDAAVSRVWRVSNPTASNGLGGTTGYTLTPTMATPTLLASPESSIGQRAGFARHNLWVTPYSSGERRAAGDFPNQHSGGDGLPFWTAADRQLVGRRAAGSEAGAAGTDVVLWYTFGVTHVPRPEDWPVMPVEYTGFLLRPTGFFDRNPMLDVPPASHCH